MEPAEFWDAHYGQKAQVWSGEPNAGLVAEVSDLAPGTALDLGCGEGGDAIWLATRGWRVTAADVSQTALDRAAAAAEAAGVADRIDWQRHDLAATFPAGTFDLVSAQFLQSPIDLPADAILRRAAAAVAPGGTLLVIGHAGPPSWAPGHAPPGGFVDPEAIVAALDLRHDDRTWELLVCEHRSRPTTGPAGEHASHLDGVVRARRRHG
jgi:SAM-dependent methyltransferase